MAKRNQYNKTTVPSLKTGEMVVKRLRVTGVAQVSGNLFVQSATAPEIRLTKSNPGAKMRMRISEGSINFATTTNYFDAGSRAAATKFSSSVAIPKYSRLDAVGLYLGTSLSGSNYIKNVGLTSSIGTTGYSDPDYFFDSAPATERVGPLAGSSSIYFPSRASPGAPLYYTGITGSNAVLYFETNAVTNSTGSITFSLYYTQYGAPTSA